MNTHLMKTYAYLICSALILCSCSTAKLEARLEANPQCKDVVNPKTGALMPCPGSDKAFYREVGLAPAKPAPAASSPATLSTTAPANTATSSQAPFNAATPALASPPQAAPSQVDCKPQIHKKTGGTLPCPAPD
ncbi:hypothetical protein [Polynucleobacter sp. AP-Reno-20A-A9]|jgi:hypothetical protein|uniref:hypothetical protein n=1 Tax=Polynucleobacter sp. AP-Reno-20A-A9 TaxID=2576925 RepID=UPI0021075D17|nr:hypothetical protein [Polynucleobacter sp. AP-Reno-20A-A9]